MNAIAPRERPKVGVGLFLLDDDGSALLTLRQGSHGAGRWSLVGGHVENGQTPQQAAATEAFEETGIVLDPAEVALGPYTNDVFDGADAGKHYITLFASARLPSGQSPRNLEPHKCVALGWFPFGLLPDNLFLPLRNFLRLGIRPPFGQTREP